VEETHRPRNRLKWRAVDGQGPLRKFQVIFVVKKIDIFLQVIFVVKKICIYIEDEGRKNMNP
jgi:hypothetical protein